jgi:CDP-paratose 2-epimerase
MGRKVVITGGAGFVGSHTAEAFARGGWEVSILDNLARANSFNRSGTDSATYNWAYLRQVTGVRRIRGSVTDSKLVRSIVKNADFVVHLAAQVAVTTSLSNPENDFLTNTVGTFNVLEACRLARSTPRVVYASTNKVYGSNVNAIPVIEGSTRYRFKSGRFSRGIPESFQIDGTDHSPYGVSKLAGDLYVQEYGHTYGLGTAVFRMSCIYGPRQIGVADQGWVSHFALSALQKRKLDIYGDGKQVRDVLYVSDLVSAYRAYLESRLGPALFNIGGGPRNTLSPRELVNYLEERLARRLVLSYHQWRPADQKVYISDLTHLENALRWRPSIQPKSGVDRLLRWARDFVRSGGMGSQTESVRH